MGCSACGGEKRRYSEAGLRQSHETGRSMRDVKNKNELERYYDCIVKM